VSAGDFALSYATKTQDVTSSGRRAATTTTAIIDSSMTVMFGPMDDVDQLATSMGAEPFLFPGLYKVDCAKANDLPDLTFTLSGVDLTIPGSELALPFFRTCLFAIVGLPTPDDESGPQWVLTDLFLRHFYTVFNYLDETVSFAKAI
jgi:saccharopepsin